VKGLPSSPLNHPPDRCELIRHRRSRLTRNSLAFTFPAQGLTREAIAAQLGVSVRSVYRVLGLAA
jgi:Homeodomain-like domain